MTSKCSLWRFPPRHSQKSPHLTRCSHLIPSQQKTAQSQSSYCLQRSLLPPQYSTAYRLNGPHPHHQHPLLHHGRRAEGKERTFQDYMIHKPKGQRENPILYAVPFPNPKGQMSDSEKTWPWLLEGISGAKG